MNPLISLISGKYMISAGLLTISLSFVITHFFHVPDALDGFLKGIGIGMMFVGLIKLKQSKKLKTQPVPVNPDDRPDQLSK